MKYYIFPSPLQPPDASLGVIPDPPLVPTLAEMLPFTALGTWPALLQPAAARARGQHARTQLRSIQPLPAAAAGVMGTSRSFFRPPGDRLQQVCLFIDLRNPAVIMIKPLRKGAQAGHLAQDRAFATVVTTMLVSL